MWWFPSYLWGKILTLASFLFSNGCSTTSLRIIQHTPGTYPRPPTRSLWRDLFHLGVKGDSWGSLRTSPRDWNIWFLWSKSVISQYPVNDHMAKDDLNLGVSKNMGFSPQIMPFNRVFHYKPSIFGGFTPYFWKHGNFEFSKFGSLTPSCKSKMDISMAP